MLLCQNKNKLKWIGVRRSQQSLACARVWLTQVCGQPGRPLLHLAGWPRGRSMDRGGSGVWQRVRGRTERAPLLLWIDTETQSMAHKALPCRRTLALNPNSPVLSPPRSSCTQPTQLPYLEPIVPAHTPETRHASRASSQNTLRRPAITGIQCILWLRVKCVSCSGWQPEIIPLIRFLTAWVAPAKGESQIISTIEPHQFSLRLHREKLLDLTQFTSSR